MAGMEYPQPKTIVSAYPYRLCSFHQPKMMEIIADERNEVDFADEAEINKVE